MQTRDPVAQLLFGLFQGDMNGLSSENSLIRFFSAASLLREARKDRGYIAQIITYLNAQELNNAADNDSKWQTRNVSNSLRKLIVEAMGPKIGVSIDDIQERPAYVLQVIQAINEIAFVAAENLLDELRDGNPLPVSKVPPILRN
jgi:hypothetical protein